MGKTCSAVMGLGLAGAIIGMHIYVLMEPREQCKVKKEFKEAVEELKKVTGKLRSMGE